jgi:hypothetical protein
MSKNYKVTGTDRIGDHFVILCNTWAEAQKHLAQEKRRGATEVKIAQASAQEMKTPSGKFESELYI